MLRGNNRGSEMHRRNGRFYNSVSVLDADLLPWTIPGERLFLSSPLSWFGRFGPLIRQCIDLACSKRKKRIIVEFLHSRMMKRSISVFHGTPIIGMFIGHLVIETTKCGFDFPLRSFVRHPQGLVMISRVRRQMT